MNLLSAIRTRSSEITVPSSLLYRTHVWTSYSAALHPHCLLLLESNQRVAHEVPLVGSRVVRSVGDDPDLPGHALFEVVFDGSPPHRFAVRSTTERAAWMSALNRGSPDDIQSPMPVPLPKMSPLLTVPPYSPPASPSIVNLSQLSMVKHRLAQIERSHSELSAQSRSPTPTPSAIRSRLAGPTPTPSIMSPASSAASAWSRREAVFLNSPRTYEDKLPPTRRASIRDNPTPRRRRTVHEKQLPHLPDTTFSQDTANKIAHIQGTLGGESGGQTIYQLMLSVDEAAQHHTSAINRVQNKVDQLRDKKSSATVLDAVEQVKSQLAANLPALAAKIEEMRKIQDETVNAIAIGKTPLAIDQKTVVASNSDLKPILEKVDQLTKVVEATKGSLVQSHDANPNPQLEKLLALIQEESNRQTLVSQQQADSVRYLNELNSWLEAFVNNGTSHIQGLALNINQLCASLGCPPVDEAGHATGPNLFTDIRQLVTGMQARDQNFGALQAAVHNLLELLTASQAQMGTDSKAIAALVARQRHEQEVMLRAFTHEISEEIKGERLRFVEAMKEATAFNVQLHVDQFKQELSRQIGSMTEEVARLHREKQQVEHQISDLRAFQSRHQQESAVAAQAPPATVISPHSNQAHRRTPMKHPHSHRPSPHSQLPRSSNYQPLPHTRRP